MRFSLLSYKMPELGGPNHGCFAKLPKHPPEEGKGIYYYNNGIREMEDYLKDKKIGKHVSLLPNGEVKTNNYFIINNN